MIHCLHRDCVESPPWSCTSFSSSTDWRVLRPWWARKSSSTFCIPSKFWSWRHRWMSYYYLFTSIILLRFERKIIIRQKKISEPLARRDHQAKEPSLRFVVDTTNSYVIFLAPKQRGNRSPQREKQEATSWTMNICRGCVPPFDIKKYKGNISQPSTEKRNS